MQDDRLRKLYVDIPNWQKGLQVYDFIVAIGVKQSNSIYHIAEVNKVTPIKNKRASRWHIKVYKSDLLTALNRDTEQALIPMSWYKRSKKN